MESAHAGDKLFILLDSLVCHLCGSNEVALVVPDLDDLRSDLHSDLGSDLLTLHHDSPMAGHLGLYRLKQALAKCCWWRGMYHDC